MLELRAHQWILGVWFVRERENVPVDKRFDWLCMVWKDSDGDDPALPWKMRYRTCQHVSDGLYRDGAPPDKRSWYEAEGEHVVSADAMLETMETIASTIAAANGVPVASVHIQGDSAKALTLLHAQPWWHRHEEPVP
jgi:hypothetical protein